MKKDNDSSAFWTASEVGDVRAIRKLARQGYSIDQPSTRNRDGLYPLHFAAGVPSADAVETLLELGAPREAADAYGSTALQHAVLQSGSDAGEAASRLLDVGADIWHVNAKGGTPYARVQRLVGAPTPLLVRMTDIATQTSAMWGPRRTMAIHEAAAKEAPDVIAAEIADAADPDALDDSGSTALMLLVRRSFAPRPGRVPTHPLTSDDVVRVLEEFWEAGAHVRKVLPDGFTSQGAAREFVAPKPVVAALDARASEETS